MTDPDRPGKGKRRGRGRDEPNNEDLGWLDDLRRAREDRTQLGPAVNPDGDAGDEPRPRRSGYDQLAELNRDDEPPAGTAAIPSPRTPPERDTPAPVRSSHRGDGPGSRFVSLRGARGASEPIQPVSAAPTSPVVPAPALMPLSPEILAPPGTRGDRQPGSDPGRGGPPPPDRGRPSARHSERRDDG
ncbi:MAG TPA: hypothetical protein VJT31_02340, partial [Rugosimonospora sp.]|nr:hypothetical protein [Rugosimonospora sp.]